MHYKKLLLTILFLPALLLPALVISAGKAAEEPANEVTNEESQLLLDTLALAEEGDADAQFLMGELNWDSYLENRQPQYLQEYTRWASLAAEQGHPDAQYGMGVRYINSTADHPYDLTEGLRLLHLAGEQESWEAQRYLSELYFRGPFFPRNNNEGLRWLRVGASQGTIQAQSRLAQEYLNGSRVLQDKIKAYLWYSMAVMQGDSDSVAARDEVETQLSIGQLSIARDLISRCFDSHFQDCD